MKGNKLVKRASVLLTHSARCFTAIFLALASIQASAAENYATNMGHSEVRFYYDHGGVAENSGEFTTFSGKLVLDEEAIANSSITMTIQANSLLSGVKKLDTQLQSDKFFSAEAHPVITFTSTEFQKISDSEFNIVGELTIRGISKTIEVTTLLHHKGRHKMVGAFPTVYNGLWVGIKATALVLRSDFEMDAFVPMISDQIRIEAHLEFKRQ